MTLFMNELQFINSQNNRLLAETYINEYQNQASLKNKSASEDYKTYMTKSLLNRGLLFRNSDIIEKLYKASFEELFSNEFKNMFVYNLNRDISGVYADINNIRNMSAIGIYDLFSSMITGIYAKYIPTFNLPEIDLGNIDLTQEDISDYLNSIIESRSEEDLPYITEYKLINIYTEEFDPNKLYYVKNEDGEYIGFEGDSFEEGMEIYIQENIIDPNFGLNNLTEEEILKIKQKILGKKLDKYYDYHVKSLLTTVKEIFSKYSIYEISQAVHIESDKYETSVAAIVYGKIVEALASIVYIIGASENLTENESEVVQMINEHISNSLNNVETISEMIKIQDYFDKIVNTYFSEDLKKYMNYRTHFKSPIGDNVDPKDLNVPLHQAYITYTENMITLRTILEYYDIGTLDDYKTVFALLNIVVMMYFQTIYMSAYLSNNKTHVVQSMDTLLRRFEPSYDKTISVEAITKFIDIGKVV